MVSIGLQRSALQHPPYLNRINALLEKKSVFPALFSTFCHSSNFQQFRFSPTEFLSCLLHAACVFVEHQKVTLFHCLQLLKGKCSPCPEGQYRVALSGFEGDFSFDYRL
jgi:hypothetical protein